MASMSKIFIAEDVIPGCLPAYDRRPDRPQPVFNWDIRKWRSQKFRHQRNNWSIAPINIGDRLYLASCVADAYLRLIERRQSGTLLISWYQPLQYAVALTFFPKECDVSNSCRMPRWFPIDKLDKESALLLSVMYA
jgi:hypothetical protein